MRALFVLLASAFVAIGCRKPAPPPPSAPASSLVAVSNGVSYARTERRDRRGRNTEWFVLRLALGAVDLDVRRPPNARLERLAQDPSVVAAVNGGFFEADGSASGLLVSRGQRIGELDPRGGSGVLVVGRRGARLVPSDGAFESTAGDVVLQCGPRLVEPDGSLGIRSDDGKRAARTVACVRDAGRELDFVLAWTRNSDHDGPGLFEMAEWLREPLVDGDGSGCEAALNLDGGPSTGVVVRGSPGELRKPYGRVPWAIALVDGLATHADPGN
jgi:hypothetical protein